MEDSLTAFVRRTLGLDPKGRNIRTVKDQLTRLASADFRFPMGRREGRSVTIKGLVIDGFELWIPKNDKQRVLWPTTVQFSRNYFESLMQHAVPLNEAAVARLAHSSMGLDVYTWLAQRLHRIDRSKPAFVPWVSGVWGATEQKTGLSILTPLMNDAAAGAGTWSGSKSSIFNR
jgi:Plasmid encoded RepA protein